MDSYSSDIVAKNIKIPTLIIHDSKDKEASVNSALEIRKQLVNGQLLITNGLGHTKILKDNLVISKIIEFIKKDS